MEDVIRMIDPTWREEFRQFVQGEDVSAGFLAYYESDQKCQEAVEMVVDDLFDILRTVADEAGDSNESELEQSAVGRRLR